MATITKDSAVNEYHCNHTIDCNDVVLSLDAKLNFLDKDDKHVLDNDFCLLQIKDHTELCCIAEYLLIHSSNLKELNINRHKLQTFIDVTFKEYYDIMFHNYHHALTTLNYTILLVKLIEKDINYPRKCEKMSLISSFTLYLAALVHDVQHPGNTNVYEVNLRSLRATKYDNVSVLENHHIEIALGLLALPECDITDGMTDDNIDYFQRHLRSNILATDLTRHSDLVTQLKGYTSAVSDVLPVTLLAQIILHTADISNCTRKFTISLAWVNLLREEFKNQYAKEIMHNLPLSSHMKECSPIDKYKSEIGYINFIVLPLWVAIVDMFPGLQSTVDRINANIQSYQMEIDNVREVVAA